MPKKKAVDIIDSEEPKKIRRVKKPKTLRSPESEEKSKKSRDRYIQSEKGKLALQKYYISRKGQEAHFKQNDQVKFFRRFNKWLKTHPNGTMAEFGKEDHT